MNYARVKKIDFTVSTYSLCCLICCQLGPGMASEELAIAEGVRRNWDVYGRIAYCPDCLDMATSLDDGYARRNIDF